jgi:hypothetical protein
MNRLRAFAHLEIHELADDDFVAERLTAQLEQDAGKFRFFGRGHKHCSGPTIAKRLTAACRIVKSKRLDKRKTKFNIWLMIIRFLIIFAVVFCASGEELSGLPKISSNYQLIGNHVVIYKSPNNKFVWGIILREHEGGGPYYSSPVKTTVSLRGGDTLELATNELTISSNGIKATQKMKPSTIYLLEENLSVQECDNLSGVELVPRQVQDGGHDGEPPAGTYITVYDLKLPDDIYDRFKPTK